MTHHNANDDQEVERPTHFKDVFGTSKDSCPAGSISAADNGLNTANVDVSESRRPSVVMPALDAASVVRRSRKATSTSSASGPVASATAGATVSASPSASTLTPIRTKISKISKITKISSSKVSSNKIPANVSGPISFASAFGAYPAGRVCKIRDAPTSRRRHCRSRSLPNIWLSLSEFSSVAASSPTSSAASAAVSSSIETGASLARRHQHHRHHRASSRRSRRRAFAQKVGALDGQSSSASESALALAAAASPGAASKGTPIAQGGAALSPVQLQQAQRQLLMPPVNLQSMHEIDLHEVLKNPQLRHDILFDPQLQFRPNLDGERGRRKKLQADNYWRFIKREIRALLAGSYRLRYSARNLENSPIGVMFQALKSILLSLVSVKDQSTVESALDIRILMQQLAGQCFDFLAFADWIAGALKMHCAPMRDAWVDKMKRIFHGAVSATAASAAAAAAAASSASSAPSVDGLVEGLRMLFSILEAMKLDVANHQIRILRPLLCSTAVSFEREYFMNAMKKGRFSLMMALLWLRRNSILSESRDTRHVLNYAVVHLLSCSHMCTEFPNTLGFDHPRLVVLRADIRHLVCTKVCEILYKQMVRENCPDKLAEMCCEAELVALKKEILSLIVDEKGNSKWTRNLHSLAVHLVSRVCGQLDSKKIDFCFNWLLTQTQPSSAVYTLLEKKVMGRVLEALDQNSLGQVQGDHMVDEELKNVVERLAQLINLNYSVFGDFYAGYLK